MSKEEIKTNEIILKFDGLYLMDIYADWNTISASDDNTKAYKVNRHSIEIKDTILYDISDEALLNVLNRSFNNDDPVPEVATIVISKLFQDVDCKVKYKEKIKTLFYRHKPVENVELKI